MKITAILSLCVVLCFLMSCEKKEITYDNSTKLSSSNTLLKVNYASLYADNRYVALKIDDERVGSVIRGRTPYPGGGYNTYGPSYSDFMLVDKGTRHFSVTLPHAVDDGTDSLILYETDITLDGGKNYILHVTDTGKNTTSVLTEETFAVPDSGTCRYSFINLMPNVPSIDIYYGSSSSSVTADTLIAAGINYLENTGYITLPSGYKVWKIRPAGAAVSSTTVLGVPYPSSSASTSQRAYMGFALGYEGLDAPRRPYISFLLVR